MKRILILLSFLAISCQSNSSEMPRQAGQASSELMNGLEAMHHVRFAEARALFLEGIEKDPNCASCYLNLGNAEQDRVLRREYLETALDLAKKGHPETKIMEASVNWINGEGGRFDAHPDLYKKYKGDKYLASGAYRYLQFNDRIDEGRELLLEAGERLKAGHLYNLLAYSYFWNAESDEEYDKGLPFIEKYIELNPNEANAYDSLAEFHLNKGEFDKAIETYQLAFEVDPEFEWATRNLALAKYQQKMASEDSKVMQWTSESDEAKSAFNMGMWQLYNLEWEQANESFAKAIEIDESFALAYAMRASMIWMKYIVYDPKYWNWYDINETKALQQVVRDTDLCLLYDADNSIGLQMQGIPLFLEMVNSNPANWVFYIRKFVIHLNRV